MLVDMYRIWSVDVRRNSEIVDLVKKVQLGFKGSAGCLGQRLLSDLKDPKSFIVVSYWRDMESLAKADEIHTMIDGALGRLKTSRTANAYQLVHEL